jgi:hypothetical protein
MTRPEATRMGLNSAEGTLARTQRDSRVNCVGSIKKLESDRKKATPLGCRPFEFKRASNFHSAPRVAMNRYHCETI